MLSSRLNAFVMPTIQISPSAIPITSEWTSWTVVPVERTIAAPVICAASFHFGRQRPEVVDQPGDEEEGARRGRGPTSCSRAVSGPKATASQIPAVIPA